MYLELLQVRPGPLKVHFWELKQDFVQGQMPFLLPNYIKALKAPSADKLYWNRKLHTTLWDSNGSIDKVVQKFQHNCWINNKKVYFLQHDTRLKEEDKRQLNTANINSTNTLVQKWAILWL